MYPGVVPRELMKELRTDTVICVLTPSPVEGSRSVSLGQCPRGPACTRSFTSYMAVSVLSSFINSLGTTPGYMITIRFELLCSADVEVAFNRKTPERYFLSQFGPDREVGFIKGNTENAFKLNTLLTWKD
ncbi:hypothetical protein QQF64_036139 [Cirrhinus molitorella]|uniref:Uncharacterized protein n=1 Tax=Cirrhinus molitorella TaxID=172907 RepID=A0ABR3NIJ1_9TELE